jgi:hypothetical protein
LEAWRLLRAALFYCHRLHVLILDGLAILLAGSRVDIRLVSGRRVVGEIACFRQPPRLPFRPTSFFRRISACRQR